MATLYPVSSVLMSPRKGRFDSIHESGTSIHSLPDGEAEGAREAKVSELDGAAVVDEEVLRLEVAVEDAVGVAVRDARQQLLHVALRREGLNERIDVGF